MQYSSHRNKYKNVGLIHPMTAKNYCSRKTMEIQFKHNVISAYFISTNISSLAFTLIKHNQINDANNQHPASPFLNSLFESQNKNSNSLSFFRDNPTIFVTSGRPSTLQSKSRRLYSGWRRHLAGIEV